MMLSSTKVVGHIHSYPGMHVVHSSRFGIPNLECVSLCVPSSPSYTLLFSQQFQQFGTYLSTNLFCPPPFSLLEATAEFTLYVL